MGRVYTNSIVLVYQVLAQATKAGIDSVELGESVGLNSEMLKDPDSRVPITIYLRLMEEVVERTGNQFFWLRSGISENSAINNPVWFYFFNAKTFREAIEHADRIYRLLSDVTYPMGVINGSEFLARIGFRHENFVPSDYLVDWILSSWLGLSIRLVGPELELKEVRITEGSPERVKAYREYFKVPITTGHSWNELVYDISVLDMPNIKGDVDGNLKNLLVSLADEKIAQLAKSHSLSDNIQVVLQRKMPLGALSIDDVAAELGMSARTLQRKLTGEGLTFSELVRDTRRKLAAEYLRQPGLNVTEVALMLGFSDVNSLTVSFRKWYGMTPREFKRQTALEGS